MCRSWVFFTFSLGAGWNANPWGSLYNWTDLCDVPSGREKRHIIYILYILTYIHIPMYRHVFSFIGIGRFDCALTEVCRCELVAKNLWNHHLILFQESKAYAQQEMFGESQAPEFCLASVDCQSNCISCIVVKGSCFGNWWTMTCSQVHHTQKGLHPKGPNSLRVSFRSDLVWKGEGLTYKCDVQHQDRLKLSVHPYFGEMIIWLIFFQMGGISDQVS